MSYPEYDGGLSRRALIKSSAIGSLALAAGAVSLPFSLRGAAAAVQQATQGEGTGGVGSLLGELRQPLRAASARAR